VGSTGGVAGAAGAASSTSSRGEASLESVLATFQTAAQRFASRLASLSGQVEQCRQSRERTEAESASLAQRLASFEEEQNAALEAEDFDKAERLQRTIDAVARSVGEVESRLDALEREQVALESSTLALYDEQARSIDVIAELLAETGRREADRARMLSAQAAHEARAERARLDDDEEGLRVELEGIGTDLGVVDRELSAINAKVEAGSVDLREQRAGWEAQLATVDAEIAELEARLAARREARAGLQAGLDKVAAGIAAVRSKYDSRLGELETRRRDVGAKQLRAQTRTTEVAEARRALDQRGAQAAERAAAMERAASDVGAQLVVLGDVVGQLRRRGRAGSSGSAGGGAAQVLQAEIRQLREQIEANRQGASFTARQAREAEQAVAKESQGLLDVEARLPALEQQKKLFVAQRNFKEAGRIAADIKAATTDKEEREAAIAAARAKLAQLTAAAAERAGEAAQLERDLKARQDGLNGALLADLNERRVALRATAHKARAAHASSAAFVDTVLFLLDAEQKTCTAEARAISVKICGDESMAELEPLDIPDSHHDNDDDVAGAEPAPAQQHDQHDQHADHLPEQQGAPESEQQQDGHLHEQQQPQQQQQQQEQQQQPEVEEEHLSVPELRAKLARIEERIDKAVEAEEFEVAAELDEALAEIRARLLRAEERQASASAGAALAPAPAPAPTPAPAPAPPAMDEDVADEAALEAEPQPQ
jgi:hypothetical protein